jgi:transcriptional regulator with XRE-family HTH domain
LASPITLADHLRRRRFDLGHIQNEAAEQIGVCPDTLQHWEADGVLPDPGVLDAVESYLGLCFVRWTRAIGPRLKAWRKARGLDQLRAARRIGVCLETVTKLEKGRLAIAALEVRGRAFDAIDLAPEPTATLRKARVSAPGYKFRQHPHSQE